MQRDSQDEQERVGALVFGVEVPDARHERLNRGFLHLGETMCKWTLPQLRRRPSWIEWGKGRSSADSHPFGNHG